MRLRHFHFSLVSYGADRLGGRGAAKNPAAPREASTSAWRRGRSAILRPVGEVEAGRLCARRMARPYPPEGSTLLVVVIRNAADGPVGVRVGAGVEASRGICADRCPPMLCPPMLSIAVAVPRYECVMKAPSDPMPPPLVVVVFCWTQKYPQVPACYRLPVSRLTRKSHAWANALLHLANPMRP